MAFHSDFCVDLQVRKFSLNFGNKTGSRHYSTTDVNFTINQLGSLASLFFIAIDICISKCLNLHKIFLRRLSSSQINISEEKDCKLFPV